MVHETSCLLHVELERQLHYGTLDQGQEELLPTRFGLLPTNPEAPLKPELSVTWKFKKTNGTLELNVVFTM